jgi:hypothetical protein
MAREFEFTFIDLGRKAQCPPNPEFPVGMAIDAGFQQMCIVDVPYPSTGCGVLRVDCPTCGVKVGFTVAGRSDDVRRVTLPCKVGSNKQIREPQRLPYGSE